MKAAIYLRLPPEGTTNEPSGADIAFMMSTYCQAQQLEPLEPYVDQDPLDLEALDRLLTDLQAGAFEVLLTDRFDRLTKDRDRLAMLLNAVNQHGIRLILLLQGIDSGTDVGKRSIQAIAEVLSAERNA